MPLDAVSFTETSAGWSLKGDTIVLVFGDGTTREMEITEMHNDAMSVNGKDRIEGGMKMFHRLYI